MHVSMCISNRSIVSSLSSRGVLWLTYSRLGNSSFFSALWTGRLPPAVTWSMTSSLDMPEYGSIAMVAISQRTTPNDLDNRCKKCKSSLLLELNVEFGLSFDAQQKQRTNRERERERTEKNQRKHFAQKLRTRTWSKSSIPISRRWCSRRLYYTMFQQLSYPNCYPHLYFLTLQGRQQHAGWNTINGSFLKTIFLQWPGHCEKYNLIKTFPDLPTDDGVARRNVLMSLPAIPPDLFYQSNRIYCVVSIVCCVYHVCRK